MLRGMNIFLMISLIIFSTIVMSETKKSKNEKSEKNKKAAIVEAIPCEKTKNDILKKLEEKKKEQAITGKGFSLQGNTDTGCSVK
jgi:Na+-translocating ferredoxin:NAD+ oxidoreductase RnfG subunit